MSNKLTGFFSNRSINLILIAWALLFSGTINHVNAQVLDKQAMLNKFSFWSNKDWNWYKENIPFFESPDKDIDLTYYYRWELMTAHLVYGSPRTGYVSTEFIDRPWWSGKYGAISCPVGHQLYEYRWFRNLRYAEDYSRYWFKTEGAQPRDYSNWLGDAIWQCYKVNYDKEFIIALKDDMKDNYREFEKEHWIESEGMFSWDGMHDGMETNINSRQTENWFAGAPGYRPTLNSYMWADAQAIKNIAELAGDTATAVAFNNKATTIKRNFQEKCWDASRTFFFHRFQNDEIGGIKANSLTYQTGKYAGNPHGRELIGFVPWYFNMPDSGYESAFSYLMDSAFFYSPYGPTTVEKRDPLFSIAKNCCAWSGNAWPYATSQTIKAMANVIRNYKQDYITTDDFYKMLQIFARTHRKNGKPYIAEANHPETGSWSGHDAENHSEHYFHSSYIDLVITGLVGIEPMASDSIAVNPLVPASWTYFALDNIRYHGQDISIIWDKDGTKYGMGKGLSVFCNGKLLVSAPVVKRLVSYLKSKVETRGNLPVNFAVNNETDQFFPRAFTSFPGIGNNSYLKLNDGQCWYYPSPANRWTSVYSDSKSEFVGIDFGAVRRIHTVKLYFINDSSGIKVPAGYTLQYLKDNTWIPIPGQQRMNKVPRGNQASVINFKELATEKIRVVLQNQPGKAVGVSELEAWGNAVAEIKRGRGDVKNLAYKTNAAFSCSYTSKFDDIGGINDGFANPANRWTAYESPNATDWIQFDFDKEQPVQKALLYFYDDKGGVQPPGAYTIKYRMGKEWIAARSQVKLPVSPVANLNICSFEKVKTSAIRIEFIHRNSKSFSGLYEAELY